MIRAVILGAALLAAGCTPGRDAGDEPGCRCVGDVPTGRLDVACGGLQCVGGTGYRCTGPMAAEYAGEACAAPTGDAGPMPPGDDGGARRGDGGGPPPDRDAGGDDCACNWYPGCDPDCDCDDECPVRPAGWTCSRYELANGYCDCGCGIRDPECTTFTIDDCLVPNGCGEGMRPDPAAPERCIANPPGWTCNGLSYDDGTYCNCGCGIADPDCPSPLRLRSCGSDGCASGWGPSPTDPVRCIENPPQDDWTCELDLLADGSTCDCGCGAMDTDCPARATASSCEATHCTTREELAADDITTCQERCAPLAGTFGRATCTNGGMVTIGGSCAMNLSRCTDGHRYEVECSGGECVCRIDSACVSRSTDGFCGGVAGTLNSVCGWSLIDDR